MERNPYQPPGAPVQDNRESGPSIRPQAVTIALFVLWFGLAVDVAYWLSRYGSMSDGSVSGAQWTGQAIGFAFASFLFVMLGRGRNWARIVLLIFTILGVGFVLFVFEDLMRAPVTLRIAALGRPLANVIGMYLVFVPGRDWFRPR
jgi:hypothetical protein